MELEPEGRRDMNNENGRSMRLKTCPFCGGRATLYSRNGGRYWFVGCKKDPACGRVCAFASELEAIDWWNSRREDTKTTRLEKEDDLV